MFAIRLKSIRRRRKCFGAIIVSVFTGYFFPTVWFLIALVTLSTCRDKFLCRYRRLNFWVSNSLI